ncbi:TPA: hypothetical protein KNH77_004030 [Clostridioides difficile]|uniref:hypothetical protein n=1 Tax=Clostridioides difficile TaxID=1496 RepID=UPI00038DA5C2|nr:hypothetical protein [Clostridioides difficile]EGT3756175.1 hypothetical protein [Clostridioides difficile]EGT3782495.1 hypothetical protein [Clostridioides difficile]EGT4158126.1 hypothetical protein [Clostridioides difficile]EGT4634170.1 hypothetical protein [Clostridioides difficile]EGT5074175.1 hypothetical protein [Clostridioides difficile]
MLKKWFGIVKKRQKSESVKEEGEVILKNEKILSEEKLIDEEGVVVNIDNEILTKVEVVNDDNEIEEKIIEEDWLISENTIKLDDKEAIINDKNIELCKKEVQVESEKIGLNKFEGLDQNENYNLEKNVIEEKKVSECLTEEDLEYIKEIKIKRGKSIKAINLYTKEEWFFDTHIQCSKKLKVPLGYIRENLKYGYMDYFGDAINYLSEVLNIDEYCKSEWSYLDNSKSPSEIFNILNNKIFSIRLSNEKRNEILTNDKIEALKMNYRFECIDEEYDEYFKKYKSIIKRGGKKKVELVNKKGDILEIFKSLEECAIYLQKEKNDVIQMLKYGDTKVGRNFIRYSLRSI